MDNIKALSLKRGFYPAFVGFDKSILAYAGMTVLFFGVCRGISENVKLS
jgi:hypothetical protein